MKKTLIFLFMLMGTVATMNAQSSQFHAGIGFPKGDFGDDDQSNDKASAAAMGFNIGYKHYKSLSTPNLSFVIGLDIFYNGLKSDTKDEYEDYFDGYDVTFPMYFNIPATVGLNYAYPVSDQVSLYGEIGVGVNGSIQTPFKIENSAYKYEQKTVYDPSFKLCYGLEGGLLIQNKYTISLRYNQLGTHKYKYKTTITSNGSKDTEKGKGDKSPISIISLTVGIKF